jgi:hypothetical protein
MVYVFIATIMMSFVFGSAVFYLAWSCSRVEMKIELVDKGYGYYVTDNRGITTFRLK